MGKLQVNGDIHSAAKIYSDKGLYSGIGGTMDGGLLLTGSTSYDQVGVEPGENDIYQQALLKSICEKTPYESINVIGRYWPNSYGFLLGNIYNTGDIHSTSKLPRYSTFIGCNLANTPTIFGTSNYNFYAKELLTSDNYTLYTVTKTGSGASGTWGINISGTASIASKIAITETTAPEGGDTYYLLYSSGTSGNRAALANPDLYYWDSGTASYLCVGSGSNHGGLSLRSGKGTNIYADLIATNITAKRAIYVPDADGVLLNSGNYSSYALPLSGGTMTGSISFKTTNYTSTPMYVVDDGTAYGHTLIMGAGGSTFIGGGESAADLYNATGWKSGENIYMAATEISFFTNCDDISHRINAMTIDANGHVSMAKNLYLNGSAIITGSITLSSDIVFSDKGDLGVGRRIHWSGSTDAADIYYRLDAADAGRLVFNLQDDANTLFCFAYNGTDIATINTSGYFTGSASYATGSDYTFRLTGRSVTDNITTAPPTGSMVYDYNVLDGTAGLFPVWHNGNSILTLNKHAGNYDSQLGFSSNGRIYYRSFGGSALDSTTGWKTIAFMDDTVAAASYAVNADTVDNYHASAFQKSAGTEIGRKSDHTRVVIALCQVNAGTGGGPWAAEGTVSYVRDNGLNAPYHAKVSLQARYGTTYAFWYSMSSDYENVGTAAISGEGYRACSFSYGGKNYAGLEFFTTQAAGFYWEGWANAISPFVVQYYNHSTGAVMDSEIYNSIRFDTRSRTLENLVCGNFGDSIPTTGTYGQVFFKL